MSLERNARKPGRDCGDVWHPGLDSVGPGPNAPPLLPLPRYEATGHEFPTLYFTDNPQRSPTRCRGSCTWGMCSASVVVDQVLLSTGVTTMADTWSNRR